jgi:hypothetical protein
MGTRLNLYGGDAIQSKDNWLISCITCLEYNCISFGANYPLENPRIKDAALPADKNSTGQKDQYSVKNLDSEDFHLRLDK